MKELSIKQKAKAYDEAIARANELNYVSDKDSLQRKTVEHIFPELKESEDKVEPKFHKGDWIAHDVDANYVYHVESVGVCYHLRKGGALVLMPFIEEKYYHLWTIQDAKDGDVLANSNISVFIYAEVLYNKPYAYCGVDKFGVFKDNCRKNDWSNSVDDIHPATKEQRDLLFQKMHEAGYEWDANKKELKKIEQEPTEDVDLPEFESYLCLMFQKFRTKGMCTNGEIIDYVNEHSQKLRDILVKPAWSEEDEEMRRKCIRAMRASACGFPEEEKFVKQVDNWLNSLKERVQPKQEWSDEDKVMLGEIIDFFENGTVKLQHDLSLYASWLKSLKPQP